MGLQSASTKLVEMEQKIAQLEAAASNTPEAAKIQELETKIATLTSNLEAESTKTAALETNLNFLSNQVATSNSGTFAKGCLVRALLF